MELLEKADVGACRVVEGKEEPDLSGMDIDWNMLLDPWYMSNFASAASVGEAYPLGGGFDIAGMKSGS